MCLCKGALEVGAQPNGFPYGCRDMALGGGGRSYKSKICGKGGLSMPDKCVVDPDRECKVMHRAEEIAADVKTLDRRMDEFQHSVSETNSRFGGRIGKLEAREEVREEQYKHVHEKLEGIKKDMDEFQRENKNSVAELRKEHKESMEELRKGNKEILDAVTPLKHKVESLEHLKEDVEELKEKPGETWEHIKKQGLGWAVALILAILGVALGLSNYL